MSSHNNTIIKENQKQTRIVTASSSIPCHRTYPASGKTFDIPYACSQIRTKR